MKTSLRCEDHANFVGSRRHAKSDVESIPAVNRNDGQSQIYQLCFAELCPCLLVDLVGNIFVTECRNSFGPRKGRAFTILIERALAPRFEHVCDIELKICPCETRIEERFLLPAFRVIRAEGHRRRAPEKHVATEFVTFDYRTENCTCPPVALRKRNCLDQPTFKRGPRAGDRRREHLGRFRWTIVRELTEEAVCLVSSIVGWVKN